MGRVLKWFGLALLVLVLLVVLAIGAAIMLIDPNDYRDEIGAAVERETGRELTIEGEINLTFWPWLGLEIGRTQLADDPAFSDTPFAEMDRIYAAVRLLPLLRRELQLDTIVLEGARAQLIVDEQGRGNWESLLPDPAEESAPKEDEPQRDSGGGIALTDLGGLQIRDASFSYHDRGADEIYRIAPLNVNIDRLQFGQPVPVSADWVAELPDGSEIAGRLNSQVVLNEALDTIRLPRLQAEVDVRLADDLAVLAELTGAVTLSENFEQALVEDLALLAVARGPDIPGGEQQARLLASRIEADLASGRYRLPELLLTAAGVEMRLQADALLGDELEASAALELTPFDARQLMRRLAIDEPERADPDTLANVGGTAALRFAGGQLALESLDIVLDETTIRGDARVHSFDGPSAEFRLAIDAIDLDRYLPPPAEEERPAGEPGDGTAEIDLPVELLRGLRLDGEFTLGRLIVSGLRVTDIGAQLHADNGLVRLDPLQASLYEGRFMGRLALDVREATPRLVVSPQLSGIEAGPLLQDLLGEPWLTGTGDVEFDLVMTGNSVDEWLSSLSGDGRFAFDDATVRGINFAQEIRVAEARLTGAEVPERETRDTDFARLTATFTAEEGIVRSDDLHGESPLLRIAGEGLANLAESTLDYRVTVNVVGTLTGAGGRELDDVGRVPIPMRVRGPFDDLSISVSLRDALTDLYREEIEEAEQELQQRLEDEERRVQERVDREAERLERRAREALRGLFN